MCMKIKKIYILIKVLPLAACIFALTLEAHSDELVFSFSNPSFSGVGYSAHVLSVEQLSFNRKAAAADEAEAAALRAKRALDSTTLARFLSNVESRIFATLSKQLVDNLFAEGSETSGSIELEGNTIEFSKVNNQLVLVITDSNNAVTNVTIPVGEFGF